MAVRCKFTTYCGSDPSHNTLHFLKLLGVVASVCTQLPTPSNICRNNNFQQCWELLRSFAHSCHTIQHQQKQQLPTMLGVVASVCTQLPTPSNICRNNNFQQCWELLRSFAQNCQHHPTSAETTTSNNVGSCCVRLHTIATANTMQHLQKQQLPAMLVVVAFVCTQLPTPSNICRKQQLPTILDVVDFVCTGFNLLVGY